jgi:tetratricopeptide (TPR) repeat protein
VMAFQLEHIALGTAFLNRIAPTQTAIALANYGAEALAKGRHALASAYYLLARQYANTPNAEREYFHQGIATLMAASRFEQAMEAAERNIGDLEDDPETLRYLSHAALAAGYPAHAARYAQALVFRPVPATTEGER